MKLGKKEGCLFDDRIDLELSPNNLQDLIALVEEQAMEEENYHVQGIWRELKDYLQGHFDKWEEERRKIK